MKILYEVKEIVTVEILTNEELNELILYMKNKGYEYYNCIPTLCRYSFIKQFLNFGYR